MLVQDYVWEFWLLRVEYSLNFFVIQLEDAFNEYISGAGLVKKEGFKGSFTEAGASAKVLSEI